MAKAKNKIVNPVDAEFTEIMDQSTQPAESTKVEIKASESAFNKAVKQITEEKELSSTSEVEEDSKVEIEEPEFLSNRFIFSECLYIVSGDERPDQFSDISEFLLDLETVLALEKVFYERLKDFGITEEEAEKLDLIDSCIIHSSAFPEAIVVIDYSFDEMVQLLVNYREIKK